MSLVEFEIPDEARLALKLSVGRLTALFSAARGYPNYRGWNRERGRNVVEMVPVKLF